MNWKQKIFTLLLASLLLSGCATQLRYYSDVDSLARPDAAGKRSYILMPGDKETGANDLQFQEFATYVDRVLLDRGFTKANSFDEADLAIFFTYAIGDPKTHQYSYSVPVFGQTGVSSATTYGRVSSYGNSATYSGTTTYTPSYGIVGATSHLGTYTQYSRFLVLDAYDAAAFKSSNEMIQVWKTSVVSTGSSGDLRLVMPYMIAAMKPHVSSNTGRKVEVVIPADDPLVLRVRGQGAPAN